MFICTNKQIIMQARQRSRTERSMKALNAQQWLWVSEYAPCIQTTADTTTAHGIRFGTTGFMLQLRDSHGGTFSYEFFCDCTVLELSTPKLTKFQLNSLFNAINRGKFSLLRNNFNLTFLTITNVLWQRHIHKGVKKLTTWAYPESITWQYKKLSYRRETARQLHMSTVVRQAD